jgi:hypothetical protein
MCQGLLQRRYVPFLFCAKMNKNANRVTNRVTYRVTFYMQKVGFDTPLNA